MIELHNDALHFSFPEVHPNAKLTINFQRTLRIPDDDKEYFLPPGLGKFPLVHVEDYEDKLPERATKRGGVILPMYQSEALWIHFSGRYPCAVKVGSGKINTVAGSPWTNDLKRKPQDYVVTAEQPWLDGFCIGKDQVRQFVAMQLGEGVTAEEQITGSSDYGGLQLIVYPMKKKFYEEYLKEQTVSANISTCYTRTIDPFMGMAPGGKMRQQLFVDKYGIKAWEKRTYSRCFVHIINSLTWHSLTGAPPPHRPISPKEYTDAGLPWFDYYEHELDALSGSSKLANLASAGNICSDDKEMTSSTANKLNPKNIVRLERTNKRVSEYDV